MNIKKLNIDELLTASPGKQVDRFTNPDLVDVVCVTLASGMKILIDDNIVRQQDAAKRQK